MPTAPNKLRAPAVAVDVDIQARWSDLDPNGHVNSAQAIIMVQEARVIAGLNWAGDIPSVDSPRVVRSINVEFDAELSYGPPITAKVWISRIGRTSYTVCHELVQEGRSCVYAETPIVVLDRETRTPSPLPDDFRERLARYQADASNPNT